MSRSADTVSGTSAEDSKGASVQSQCGVHTHVHEERCTTTYTCMEDAIFARALPKMQPFTTVRKRSLIWNSPFNDVDRTLKRIFTDSNYNIDLLYKKRFCLVLYLTDPHPVFCTTCTKVSAVLISQQHVVWIRRRRWRLWCVAFRVCGVCLSSATPTTPLRPSPLCVCHLVHTRVHSLTCGLSISMLPLISPSRPLPLTF